MSLHLFKQWILESQKSNPEQFGKVINIFESIFESTEDVVETTANRLGKMSSGLDSIDDILGDINLEPEMDDSPEIDINAILGDGNDENQEFDELPEDEPIEEGFSD